MKEQMKKHYRIAYLLLFAMILVFIYIIFFNKSSNVYIKGNTQHSDVMSVLMNEMSEMNSRMSTEIGWVMTVISIIMGAVGFYSYNQWKMSSNGIENLRKEFKDQFHIEFMQKKIMEIQKNTAIQREEIEKSKKINLQMLSELSKNKIKTEKLNKALEKVKEENFIVRVKMIINGMTGDEDEGVINARIIQMESAVIALRNDNAITDKDNFYNVVNLVSQFFINVKKTNIHNEEIKKEIIDEGQRILKNLHEMSVVFDNGAYEKNSLNRLENVINSLKEELSL